MNLNYNPLGRFLFALGPPPVSPISIERPGRVSLMIIRRRRRRSQLDDQIAAKREQENVLVMQGGKARLASNFLVI